MYLINSLKTWCDWFIARMDKKRCLCPSCGGEPAQIIDKRFGILTLARCKDCNLLFRQPTDDEDATKNYYQGEYHDPLITDIPKQNELNQLVKNSFQNKFNRSEQIKLVRHLLGEGKFKILDYGCSWGYASWQFINAGFEVEGFELSRGRAEFAKNWLNIPIYTDESQLQKQYDLIYSCHVFEHVPRLTPLVKKLSQLIVPGGYIVAITPNGGEEARQHHPKIWHKLWGKRHPIFLDSRYWFQQFDKWPKIAFSRHPFSGDTKTPFEQITKEAIAQSSLLDMTGDELTFIAQKPMESFG